MSARPLATTGRSHAPGPREPGPVVFPPETPVIPALQALDDCGQAMAFVGWGREVVGVVTVADLRFAWDWGGPSATVADATTHLLVEIDQGADETAAAAAFAEGLRRWLRSRDGRLHPTGRVNRPD